LPLVAGLSGAKIMTTIANPPTPMSCAAEAALGWGLSDVVVGRDLLRDGTTVSTVRIGLGPQWETAFFPPGCEDMDDQRTVAYDSREAAERGHLAAIEENS
jgi:hypothetical protein